MLYIWDHLQIYFESQIAKFVEISKKLLLISTESAAFSEKSTNLLLLMCVCNIYIYIYNIYIYNIYNIYNIYIYI